MLNVKFRNTFIYDLVKCLTLKTPLISFVIIDLMSALIDSDRKQPSDWHHVLMEMKQNSDLGWKYTTTTLITKLHLWRNKNKHE